MGLASLLETVAFESFLSRVSDQIGAASTSHYHLSAGVVKWFTLHGEVDVRHAEEGRHVVRTYISHYRFSESEAERIVGSTFAKNAVLNRYFPDDSPSSILSGPLCLKPVEMLPMCIPFAPSFEHTTMSRASSGAVIVRVTDGDSVRDVRDGTPTEDAELPLETRRTWRQHLKPNPSRAKVLKRSKLAQTTRLLRGVAPRNDILNIR